VSRDAGLAALAGAALAAWLTYPTIVHPASMARMDSSDGQFSVWNVAWVAHALTTDPRRLFDANIFHPHRGTLAYSEANLVAGALAVPPYLVTGHPVAAHNVVVYAAFVLSFVATWTLVRRFVRDGAVALVPAAGFAFAPFVAARTAHIQLLMVFVFPVVLLALHRLVERPGPWRGAVLGLALALAALACGYYGIFAGLVVAWGALWFGWRRRRDRRYWTGFAAAGVVAALVVGPVLAPYLELRSAAGARGAVNLEELRSYSADLRAYLTSPAHAHAWLMQLFGVGREVLFPGFVVTALALVNLRGRRQTPETPGPGAEVMGFYASVAVLACWASFGPDAGLYRWLSDALPFMSFLRAPARIGIVVVLALAVLGGFGLATWRAGRGRRAAAFVLTIATAAEVSAAPWPLRPVPRVPDAHRLLAGLPPGPVVEFHFPYMPTDLHHHSRYLFWSMWHWQPLVNGYSDYIPPDFRELMVPINGFPDGPSFRILRDRGVRYVTIHLDSYNPEARAVLMARFPAYRANLRPLIETGDVWLYEIVEYPDS
jgi:hypothetical protein